MKLHTPVLAPFLTSSVISCLSSVHSTRFLSNIPLSISHFYTLSHGSLCYFSEEGRLVSNVRNINFNHSQSCTQAEFMLRLSGSTFVLWQWEQWDDILKTDWTELNWNWKEYRQFYGGRVRSLAVQNTQENEWKLSGEHHDQNATRWRIPPTCTEKIKSVRSGFVEGKCKIKAELLYSWNK